MPALKRTDHSAIITWLGRVPKNRDSIASGELSELTATFSGIQGEHHHGLTRPSCSRVTGQYPVGTEIRNTRQISIVSAEELAKIASALGLPDVDPSWLGANMVLSGIADFSHIPPSSRLQAPSGATVTIDLENRPCNFPARLIEDLRPGHGLAFRKASQGLRGVTGWVEREGVLRVGDRLALHIPDQPNWAPSG